MAAGNPKTFKEIQRRAREAPGRTPQTFCHFAGTIQRPPIP